jgi:anhydro-N-acetylmuramic acid kinase
MGQATRLIAGAMSGTSGDGVDVAIVRITGTGLDMSATLVHHHHVPFDAGIRQTLFAIRDTQTFALRDLAKLGREISLTYARAVNEALASSNLHANDLSAVAAHGQTLYHDPPNTIQWFDPSLVAAEVGCPVVSDFRRADCAAGGQGAPLVPFADYILFRDQQKHRVLLNIGGIANVTRVPARSNPEQVVAFDTGPGNCISDYLCRKHQPQGRGFDDNGELAASGVAQSDIAHEFLQHPYFRRRPPKSTDGPEMIRAFEQLIPEQAALNDLLATALRITSHSISLGIKMLPGVPDQIIVSGGGTKNAHLMKILGGSLSTASFPGDVEVLIADELGIPSDAKEAIAFALLGAATLDRVPSNVPSVTGAKRAVVLGSITTKP